MAKYLTEGIGSFFLVLTIGLSSQGASDLAPVAIGGALMVLVYMGGPVSGGHYNPAVSIALAIGGRMERSDLGAYICSQLAGSLLAAFAVLFLTQEYVVVAPNPSASLAPAYLAEGLFAFLLVLVVLNAAASSRTEGNQWFGLAIGFTVMVGAFSVGGISGAAFNPSVGTGPIIAAGLGGEGWAWAHLLLYWAAPVLGGVLAHFVFETQEKAG